MSKKPNCTYRKTFCLSSLVTYRRLPMTDRAKLKTEQGAANNIRRRYFGNNYYFLNTFIALAESYKRKKG